MTELTILLLAGLVVAVAATGVGLARRRYGLAAAAAAAAAMLAYGLTVVAPWLAAAVAAGLAVVGWVRFTRTSATVSRWGARSRRKAGVASTVDIARLASWVAMRRKATVVRPSLGDLTRWQRARTATTEVAVPLCRVGALRVWSPIEDVVCLFGGPRTGKTGHLAGTILDAPGAVVSTSTRTDLLTLTGALRRAGGRPVWVFNPGGLGDVASTLTFDPLTGCTSAVTATERAADMIPETDGGGDRAYWEGQARRVLAALLHAAALGALSMREVLGWVADPDAAHREVTSLLRRSPEPAFAQDAAQWLTTNDKTRSSITSTIMPALGWLTSAAAVAATTGGHQLDVAELLGSRATVYLLGRHEAHTAPLLAALTGHIARQARRIAARQPGGRLDPPLTLALDEAARIAPVPLPDWSGDAGGSGLCIVAAFQSRADLVDRWGPTGAAKIINNSGSIVLFGGTKDDEDLARWSRLAGDRDEPVTTTDHSGRTTARTVRQVPVLAAAQLANLPTGRVVVFRRGMPPVIGRVRMAWRRRDVRAQARAQRRQRRAEQRLARAVVAGAEAATRHAAAHTHTAREDGRDERH